MSEAVQQLSFAALSDPQVRASEVLTDKDVDWQATIPQRTILRRLLYAVGSANAVTLRKLMDITGKSDRDVKKAISSLVIDFKVRVGASRGENPGYYLITNRDEALATAQPYINEIKELYKRIRVILDPHDLAEFEGQLLLAPASADAIAEEEERHL